jgi:hypothetical protein
MKLAWGAKVSDLFVTRLFAMVSRLGWQREQANDVMACMAFESDETFSPSVPNKAGSGAVGLIQFMPLTALGLGTTVENLKLLSAESQLDYVEMYFLPYARNIHTLPDMYMAILLPKYIKYPDTAVLFSGNGASYRQNAGLDANSDGQITKAEATARVQGKLIRGLSDKYSRIVP